MPRHRSNGAGAFVFLHPALCATHTKEHDMTAARKIEPALTKEMVDKTLKGIQKAEGDVVTRVGQRVGSWFKAKTSAHNLVLASVAMGLLVTVREVDRQRRAMDKLKEANDAMIQYVGVLVDETPCGQDAYTWLQLLAEEESETTSSAAEEVAEWTAEDENPIADRIIVIEE